MKGRMNAITPRNPRPFIAVWGYLSRFLLRTCPKRCSQVEHYADFCCWWLVVVAVDNLKLPKSGLTVLFVVVVFLGNCGQDPDKGSTREVSKPGSCFPYYFSQQHPTAKVEKIPMLFCRTKSITKEVSLAWSYHKISSGSDRFTRTCIRSRVWCMYPLKIQEKLQSP